MIIGFDLMGSDSAPKNELETLKLLKDDPICDILVCGKGDYEKLVTELGFEFKLADQVVGMHEIPSVAIRQKRNSSIGVLVNMLKKKEIDAIVSAGNTGAILGFSMIMLGNIEGLSRAGIAIALPAESGYSILLDVGSNINPKTIDYYNYGQMGAILAEVVLEKKKPRVAILNIGSESGKGDETRQKAYKLLEESDIDFIGNIEGNNMMKGFADVIVTDGFTGNVILKFLEGMIDNIMTMLKDEVDDVARRKFGRFLVRPAIEALKAKFNYEEYGGGILVGVQGVAVICHGHSSPRALKNAIKLSSDCVEFNIVDEIKKRIKT